MGRVHFNGNIMYAHNMFNASSSSSSSSSYSSSPSSAASSLISQRWFSAAVQQAAEEVKVVVDVSEGKSPSHLIVLQILVTGVHIRLLFSISVNCVPFYDCSAFLKIHPRSQFSFLWKFPIHLSFPLGRNRKSSCTVSYETVIPSKFVSLL